MVGALAEPKEGTELGRRNLEQPRDLADDGDGRPVAGLVQLGSGALMRVGRLKIPSSITPAKFNRRSGHHVGK